MSLKDAVNEDLAVVVEDHHVQMPVAADDVDVMVCVVGSRKKNAMKIVQRVGVVAVDGEEKIVGLQPDLTRHAATAERADDEADVGVLNHYPQITAVLQALSLRSGDHAHADSRKRHRCKERGNAY